jgi:hypothetical protein
LLNFTTNSSLFDVIDLNEARPGVPYQSFQDFAKENMDYWNCLETIENRSSTAKYLLVILANFIKFKIYENLIFYRFRKTLFCNKVKNIWDNNVAFLSFSRMMPFQFLNYQKPSNIWQNNWIEDPALIMSNCPILGVGEASHGQSRYVNKRLKSV